MQLADDLICQRCKQQYASNGDLVPRLLPECGHTLCTACLNKLLQETEGAFYCPEDKYPSPIFKLIFIVLNV